MRRALIGQRDRIAVGDLAFGFAFQQHADARFQPDDFLFLPGHDPMLGTVRWVVDKRFGIETDRAIDTSLLRAAHGGSVPATHAVASGFEIIPPPTAPPRRPGLVLGAAQPGHFGRSVWMSKRE